MPNRLINAVSPYLLQHAHNPVDWYEWGEEAIARARAENKPILISIGYSTCYWCHVMEREVFEKPDMAAVMNAHFINVKIDREERPELDEIYMSARQLITREGGWPNNVFLTPELKPFFACGTMMPQDSYGRPGWQTLLNMIHESWLHRRQEVDTSAEQVTERVQALLATRSRPVALDPQLADRLAELLVRTHDETQGGFGGAPKFPHETYLLFLLDHHRITGDARSLEVARRSLDQMAAGGIFDHVGGGFHRYAVDEAWRVPHFEKMLYNQALCALAYARAYAITSDPYYEYIARSTLDFVAQHMTGPDGQFYSALDAETEQVEGAYYVWSEQELSTVLAPGALEFLKEIYDFAELPHFPGHKHPDGGVLFARAPLDALARHRGVTYNMLQEQVDKVLGKLLLARSRRNMPLLDTKVIASWNGMMIDAFADAGRIFADNRYVAVAEKAAEFMLENMLQRNGQLVRIYKDGAARGEGQLEDYVFTVQGLLALAKATRNNAWIGHAVALLNVADDLFYDASQARQGLGGFFSTRARADLLVQGKGGDDSAIPSGNAIMVHNLVDMAEMTVGTEWQSDVWASRAQDTVRAFSSGMNNFPERYVHMIHGYLRLSQEHNKPIAGASTTEGNDAQRANAPSKTLASSHYVKVETSLRGGRLLAGHDHVIDVTLKIGKGWHITPSPAPRPFLKPTLVQLKHRAILRLDVQYPAPNASVYVANEGILPMYEDVVQVHVQFHTSVALAAGEIVTLPLVVQFQVCNDSQCLMPSTVTMEMPLIVARE